MTDTKALAQKVSESGVRESFIAKSLGITQAAWWHKKNAHTEFKQSEIVKVSQVLHLTAKEVRDIFLT